jgi:hypothetical protein
MKQHANISIYSYGEREKRERDIAEERKKERKHDEAQQGTDG